MYIETIGHLEVTGDWQFSYKAGYQVIDVTMLICLMGQKCMEWGLPLILGVTDIPKFFDEVSHAFLFEALLVKGLPCALAAWRSATDQTPPVLRISYRNHGRTLASLYNCLKRW